MIAAILLFCGVTVLTPCSKNDDSVVSLTEDNRTAVQEPHDSATGHAPSRLQVFRH